MVSLHTNFDFIIDFIGTEVELEKFLLADDHLDGSMVLSKGIQGSLGKTICSDGIKTEICLGGIIDDEYRVFELALRLDKLV